MLRFLGRRLGYAIITVGLVLTVVFWMSRVAGDPVRLLAGFDATDENLEQIRSDLGLDEPLVMQYGRFVGDISEGDFGKSFRTGRPAMGEVMNRLPATLSLAAAALVFAVVVAVPLGILAALKRGRWPDTVARFIALVGQAVPNFWLGLLFIFFFAVRMGWFPTGGRNDGFRSLILPALTLSTASVASLTRLTRSAMIDVLNQDYITLARLKGLKPHRVIVRHGLSNALIPILTILGLQIGLLLAGSVVVETIFAWPGIGRLVIQSLEVSDYPVVQAAVLVIALSVVLANLATDVIYMLVDPRIRYD
ncbi:MAG: ABC transporter permease [Desertimonas sp.]